MKCNVCRTNDVDPRRFALGFTQCLPCGEKIAAEEIKRKQSRVAVGYNKGPLLYMGDEEVARANLQGSMNAQGRSQVVSTGAPSTTIRSRINPETKCVRIQRRPLGVMWINNDPMFFYSEDDTRLSKASKRAFFDGRSTC